MSELLLQQRADGVAILTLNRPERLNALNYALIDTLSVALDELEADDGVRGIVVTGAGERAFSAGADISEFRHSIRAGTGPAIRDFCRRGQTLTRRLENFPKPIVAAINGLAYGGGCEISEAMSFTIAAEAALAAVNRGVNVSIDEGLAIESAQFARLVPTRDLAEGIAAFLEKREPGFLGQ